MDAPAYQIEKTSLDAIALVGGNSELYASGEEVSSLARWRLGPNLLRIRPFPSLFQPPPARRLDFLVEITLPGTRHRAQPHVLVRAPDRHSRRRQQHGQDQRIGNRNHDGEAELLQRGRGRHCQLCRLHRCQQRSGEDFARSDVCEVHRLDADRLGHRRCGDVHGHHCRLRAGLPDSRCGRDRHDPRGRLHERYQFAEPSQDDSGGVSEPRL